jgi:bifunctional UDP-N-acetylglucosamine pyrophosphorylase/glucosamine-1-phosphate N-acetyltransferase
MGDRSDRKTLATLAELSDDLALDAPYLGVVLAAGHGKRIKSEIPKMLHEIWGVSTVERVSAAVSEGLRTDNQIVVVGAKADEVAEAMGRRPHTAFAYQREQKGTGHAVQIALKLLGRRRYGGGVLVTPGDVGLLTGETIRQFVGQFRRRKWDMAILTAIYDQDQESNYYGRIVRGGGRGRGDGEILAIVEYKDIVSADPTKTWRFDRRGETYEFRRDQLLENREFNTGIFLFRAAPLRRLIAGLGSDNVQGEIYLTDIVNLFVERGLTVGGYPAREISVCLGFNNKTVLNRMEAIARERVYDRLRDIVTIKDGDRFFLAESVAKDLLRMDRKGKPLDIVIGEDAAVRAGAKLNYRSLIGRGAELSGEIVLGQNVEIGNYASVEAETGQAIRVGDGSSIGRGSIVKGVVSIGKNVLIDPNTEVSGVGDFPVKIGDGVRIGGSSKILGCIIEPDVRIEHSILEKQRISRVVKRDGRAQPVRFVLPQPEGTDSLEALDGSE